MNSIFHTEAPEKVRTLPEIPPRKARHGSVLREVFYLVLFFGLLAVLMLGCYEVYSNPNDHYPLHKVNVQQPAEPPASSQTGTALLQPVTKLAANNGVTGSDVPNALDIIATNKTSSLTNRDFIYYYWDGFYSIYSQMGSYLASYLNFAMPFDQQMASQTQTWHQYLAEMAVEAWHQTDMLYNEAVNAGHRLDEAGEQYLADSREALETYAAEAGYADGASYLRHTFDPCADVDSYMEYNRRNLLVSSYTEERYQQFYDQVYDPNAQVQYCANVRHILLQPGEGEDMTAALKRAEELYEQWKADPTEDHFAALAAQHTTDPGSQTTGGLYEDVYPGQMVQNFNDWCFDDARKVGDTGIVETEYGYHIMYYSGQSETVYSDANDEAAQQSFNAWLDELFLQDTCQSSIEKAVFTEKLD